MAVKRAHGRLLVTDRLRGGQVADFKCRGINLELFTTDSSLYYL